MKWLSAILIMSLSLAFTTTNSMAREQAKTLEVFGSIGAQTVLRPVDDLGTAGVYSGQINYNITNTQTIGIRYAGATYESLIGDTLWQTSGFVVYRYNFRKDKPTKIYLEAGAGSANPIDDLGIILDPEFAATFALGVKRFLGQNFSLGIETRGIGTSSDTGINEVSLTLGYMF